MKTKITLPKTTSIRNHAVSSLLGKGGTHTKDTKKGKRKAERNLSKTLCRDF